MGRSSDRATTGDHGRTIAALAVPMSAGTVLIVLMRWAHALAAIVWLGGGVYATMVLAPRLRVLRSVESNELREATARDFGRIVNVAMAVFVLSGVLLTFDRLSGRGATPMYGVVLAIKVALALWMFAIAQRLQRRVATPRARGRAATLWWRLSSPRLLLWLGAIVVLLAAILKVLYERALVG